ncbi:MAG: chemotaxis protein CheA [gamma proteobacterium symbiont of Bathyaustriella thionipta]|nr:chemotaxis protein CheA [gamma proteobacterium symbiont of Bathyaustriella thionipta]MCU7949659.1 chemotaxis protein CheA [gamma proteobacterium symbiont of Bathyaustriella thionipta]MCU7954395.1 chemotaxis protein CheA [gamma proteobacterium symbiont of Bathyaustriella thionipta]MCU7956238.1 chemotaxis protein CheA [gamma proteobacterium symbiont of Bathyaustriella thionipta]
MEIDENLQIFISEGEELLQEMEESLLALEESGDDDEILNKIFRAAHTIKGSAGLFGLDHIIHFTHIVENILDDMRNCLIPISSELITVLMRSQDYIATLLDGIADDFEGNKKEEAELIQLLTAFKTGGSEKNVCEADQAESEEQSHDDQCEENIDDEYTQNDHFHISLRLGSDTFRQGFDPASMFRELADLGEILHTAFIPQALPNLDDIDPESCYLGWEISLKSHVKKEVISEIFQFLDDCKLTILAPQTHFSDYKHLIEQLPEEEMALGQILIQTGSLTADELQHVLNQQKENIDAGELASQNLTGDILIENKIVHKEVVEEALNKQSKVREQKQKALNFVKVDSGKLDKLINLVGELVINGAKLNQITETIQNEELEETMEGLTMSLEELREIALGLRMVPIGMTFNRFHRVIRDISKDLNKEIKLEIYGADTELDKTVIEKIGDPLMHLIRNSLDHGIEMPDERQRAGKPEEGIITLQAQHEAGYITIQIIDDGKGLDHHALREKALEKGIIDEHNKLTRQECFNLIFAAGFSTAQEISNISGRGVGMDVVRRNIESLRGNVYIDSELGVGTTITIQLPLTLAIIDGFNVSIDNESYIFPLDMVHECLTLTPAQIEEATVQNYITLRDDVLPIIHLKEYFDVDNEQYNETYMTHSGRERHNLVVVEFSNKKIGLVVDELLGEVQAVIKPLGRVFKGLSGFAGFTILGSGMVALVLDIPSLIKHVVGSEHQYFDSLKQKSIASKGNRVVH